MDLGSSILKVRRWSLTLAVLSIALPLPWCGYNRADWCERTSDCQLEGVVVHSSWEMLSNGAFLLIFVLPTAIMVVLMMIERRTRSAILIPLTSAALMVPAMAYPLLVASNLAWGGFLWMLSMVSFAAASVVQAPVAVMDRRHQRHSAQSHPTAARGALSTVDDARGGLSTLDDARGHLTATDGRKGSTA